MNNRREFLKQSLAAAGIITVFDGLPDVPNLCVASNDGTIKPWVRDFDPEHILNVCEKFRVVPTDYFMLDTNINDGLVYVHINKEYSAFKKLITYARQNRKQGTIVPIDKLTKEDMIKCIQRTATACQIVEGPVPESVLQTAGLFFYKYEEGTLVVDREAVFFISSDVYGSNKVRYALANIVTFTNGFRLYTPKSR